VRPYLTNGLLLLASMLVCLVAAEGVARWSDGLPVFTRHLPATVGVEVTPAQLDGVARVAGVPRDWFFDDPPPLPNRHQPPEAWRQLDELVGRNFSTGASVFYRPDMFKAWNAAFVGDPCKHIYLHAAPGRLFVFDTPDGAMNPIYRFLPDATTPVGLVTNAFGWRGPPVPFKRSPHTVRIVFVGASTTVSNHTYPYSYPEFIGHWLDLWAAARKLDVRFEVLNAGRESVKSTDIEAIVREEVAPLHPDLVVYYEGANQFELSTVVKNMPKEAPPRASSATPQGLFARTLRDLAYDFALARRLQALVGAREVPADGHEWPKPGYEVTWPAGLDESDPDLGRPDLPVHLGTILGDLDRIRTDLAAVDSEFVMSSFKWLAKDGLVLDPIRHKDILEDLNIVHFPFRYRDLERLADFQNRVLAKYAATHGLTFFDVARDMPSDPDLFTDAIHDTYPGVRLRAWIVLQKLLPLIEQRLASGAWPKPVPAMGDVHPAFRTPPREITFQCKAS
jgi:hypothetical protein